MTGGSRRVLLDDHLAAELDRALAYGPFAAAVRAAILASGLTLDRIQARLARRGAPLSVATLSCWQSGRRRPERPGSLYALGQLEAVLELPGDSLRALLGARGARGRRPGTGRLPALADLWVTRPRASELLRQVGQDAESVLRRLSQHDRLQVGPDGRPRRLHCRQVMRAERAGADRWLLMMDWGGPPGEPLVVRHPRNCALGRVLSDPESSLGAAELLFDRPVREGETVLIEYELVRPGRPGAPVSGDRYSRRFRRPVREYVLEVCFDAAAVPGRCRQITCGVGDETPKTVRALEVGPADSVHAVGTDFGPGKFGIAWQREIS
ncbi:hypothetical protein [Amycolatopsis samaneae]|uniref:Transcriptional regulator n=1 Tax=Amycolatopsis samaneae TaxID=664691 RepID=A0ABW5GR03_9PSEU